MTSNPSDSHAVDAAEHQPHVEGASQSAMDNPFWLLVVLFLGIGALGLPLLRKSRAFSPGTKKVLSVVVILYTIMMVLLLLAAIVAFIGFILWIIFPGV